MLSEFLRDVALTSPSCPQHRVRQRTYDLDMTKRALNGPDQIRRFARSVAISAIKKCCYEFWGLYQARKLMSIEPCFARAVYEHLSITWLKRFEAFCLHDRHRCR